MKKTAAIAASVMIILGIITVFITMICIKFNFTKLNTEAFELNTHNNIGDFNSIKIDDSDYDIKIMPSKDGKASVICNDSEKRIHIVEVKDNTLFISQKKSNEWYDNVGIYFDNDLNVTVFVPEKEYESIKINSAGGDIKIKDIACGKFNIHSSSGDIELSNVSALSLKADTASGDIDLQNTVCDDTMKLNSSSGDIELDFSDAKEIDIKTASGSVEGILKTGKEFITKTASGNTDIPQSNSEGGKCTIKTASGDIEIKVAG